MSVKEKKIVQVPHSLTVRELAMLADISPIDVIKELMNNGIMANINQTIDYDTAVIILDGLGLESCEQVQVEEKSEAVEPTAREQLYATEDPASLKPRPPVVTVMGHVDHGKTSLLDVIRSSNVVGGEVGGITQHIGAHQVEHNQRKITFLDTPGHEAFTAMRARGAQVTDIAILVVAADDGVMPQTLEAIAHAKAARVPIIVALNKIDKPNASPDKVKQQLADHELLIDEYGGDTLCIPVSAKQKIGIDDLMEAILLVADNCQIKANPDRTAVGTVIESRMDRSRGAIATLLVQNGTLKQGDALLIGTSAGRIRAMFDQYGQPTRQATPSTPVEVMGLGDVPEAGEAFQVVKDEKIARARALERKLALDQVTEQVKEKIDLESLFALAQAGKIKELPLVIKVDVQGSLEPIVNSLEKLSTKDPKVNILHTGTGNINESDIMLAAVSKAVVIGFTVGVDTAARRLADAKGVDVRCYNIIYKLIEDIDKALTGMLEPVYADKLIGQAEVRAAFKIKSLGMVAGCMVREGLLKRDAKAQVWRQGQLVHEGIISSLKRLKEDAKEVKSGFECGVGIEGFTDYQEGDIIQAYVKERVS
ncbi:MAG: translation initiation factor IF-2 [Thermoflexales bacterium]|nr:translation initiation factor IF-2 [Thermoflexales bacterium]